MPKKVHHIVKRPGLHLGDPDIEIPVAEDLVTVPGNPTRETDHAFYSREYPLESQNIEKAADRDWGWTVYTPEVSEYRKQHDEANKPLVEAALTSGDIEPTGETDPGRDFTEDVRSRARELGFGEVGFTKYDRRYTYASKKRWAKFPHVVCLALEQDYAQTQTIPSLEAEYAHFGTYEVAGALALRLSDYIRSLGYSAQIHSPNDNSGPYIPLFVNAGLGQLGANGQLLSPHFGSRARLLLITTDGPLKYDAPVDYGINNFCDKCQVCVARCPARALVKEKVWWRGAKKNKLIYDRCRPVMVTYDGCGVCMKVCPVQRYGMKPVMEHYVETGEVLGKGTDNLEGYELREKGYFGPGKMPHFSRELFEFPHGGKDDWLLHQFKERLLKNGAPSAEDAMEFASSLKEVVDAGAATTSDE
jgi:ferredoxin